MILLDIALFVHMVGLIALFGALVLLEHGGRRLRGARTWQDARAWLALLRPVRGMFLAGAGLLLASGLYMTVIAYSFALPWVTVALLCVAALPVVWMMVADRRLAALVLRAEAREGTIPADDRAWIADPALWGAVLAMNGAALGVLWLMTIKPGWAGAIAAPLLLGVIGGVLGMARAGGVTVARRGESLRGAAAPGGRRASRA